MRPLSCITNARYASTGQRANREGQIRTNPERQKDERFFFLVHSRQTPSRLLVLPNKQNSRRLWCPHHETHQVCIRKNSPDTHKSRLLSSTILENTAMKASSRQELPFSSSAFLSVSFDEEAGWPG